MARGGTTSTQTRSQRTKPSRASQGRGRPQPKRDTRAQHADSGEENEDGDGDDDEALHDEMDVDGDGGGGSQDGVDINLKANQLVRLALFMEHRRMPLRRDDISKKVFGPSSRASRPFNRVLERAQFILNRTFGMELVELQSRAALDKAAAAPDPTALNEEQEEEEEEPAATQGKGRGKATGLKKKALPVGGKSYILRSILHPTIISFAALPDEEILSAELDDAPDELNDDDDGTPAPSQTPGGHRQRAHSASNPSPQTCTGTLLSFSSSTLPALENVGALGVQYVLLSLILASGRLMSDRELRATLRQLHLPPGASVPLGRSAHNHLPGTGGNSNVTIEAYLQLLMRQGYIDRISSDEAGKPVKTSGGKRGRAAANIDAEDGENKYDWRWGPRAHSEIGEKAIQEFISEFMVEISGRQDNQDDGEGARVQERLKKMMNGIEKAAGGNISDIK
ncbi:MAGE-domain-containing protein [Lentinula guzmanii]|uniref:MAGE-domain-containing protein n=2 Tax=Lentinula TaxID=5352 RepID=A0AA38J3S2_9AGAR|nr:MAGE-domain-containing protein [Lentinula guzmanii]KAJ3793213.1 MAGE-domain-containing protein [Lentinula aff. detonsa]